MTDYRDIYTDFEEEMIRSYPRLFKNFVAQPFRGWAHCIGPEWFDIIRTMAVKLESELTEAEQLSFCLSDIKEKHGQLRIYWGNMMKKLLNLKIKNQISFSGQIIVEKILL